jgi:tRNA A-37 threonylcarbamoyl transferase component Bud32/tetratricopeptide (TPR) repeat protein
MNTVFHRLGPYEVLREIGRGGMALVLLATDTRSGQDVALKLVQRATTGEAREIFEAEQSGAELQRQFSQASGHVPAVYEHLSDESGYFVIAMEYLDGENLSDAIARGAIEVDRAVKIAIELCTFLEAAHSFEAVIGDRKLRSLVHGDLKPQNVRITSSGAVKVLDFGIAKALSLSRKVTRNDFGTTPYLSPERLDGEVNEYADMWAVGVMLHEMIRGRRPFDAPDTHRLERLIRSRIPPQPLTGRCPLGLEAIVARMLGPTVAVRYESARAIREDLERFVAGEKTIAEDQGWPARSVDPVDPEATRRTMPPLDEEAEKTRRTRPAAAPAAAAAARARSRPPARRRLAVLGASALLMFGLTTNECSVAADARKVAAAASTQELHEIGKSWSAFEQLLERSHLGWGTLRLERLLTERTLSLADKVIGNYRMALPTVREAQWQLARDALARAIPFARDDQQLRAAFRYCDGHLHRINGEARKGRNQDGEAQRELTEAVAAFREAADLRRDWPDPFLGLARTFIYGLEDIDRGADALAQAERRGYRATERETGQLADGYRARGNSFVKSARELTGMPQESDYLARAVEAYQRALTLYTQAASLSSATTNIRATQRALDYAQLRLGELTPGAGIEPVQPMPLDTPPPEPEFQQSEAPLSRHVAP